MNQNVQVDGDSYVKEVREYIIHESLECRWRISESKWHDHPFKGPITGMESCLPFVTFYDADQMVRMTEV